MEQKTKLRIAKSVVIFSVVPLLIHAYEYGPDAGAAGVPGENGSCNQAGCHTGTPVNGGGGSVTVTFPGGLTYTPGASQHLVVTIDDSKQRRWGFELTARLDSDVTQVAGTFTPTDSRTQLMCSSKDLVQQLNFNKACPANLPLEYIEQTLTGYSAIQANPGKYEFDWSPPATDVGSVTIYVAANAANGDLTQNGDHIYTATYSLTAAGAAPSPAITSGGVLTAASQAIPGLPNSVIAQGSIFIINGNTLGSASAAQAGLPLQTSLAGTSVQVTVNGTSLAAPISAISSTQVTAIMPSAIPPGSGTVTVTFNGQTSAPAPVQIAPANFGIYTLNGAGSGPAQASDANGNAITLTNPAQPSGTVTLSGTGLGPLSADDVSQPSMQDVSSSVSLYIGSEQAPVQYAGRAGSAPGQDQVTFTVPADAITGCYVPVSLVVNNITSNFATIPVAPAGSSCSDGNGFTTSQTQQIQSAAGNVRLATINLARTASAPGPTTIDSGSAAFGMYTPAQLMSSLGPWQTASPGGCLVFGFTGNSATVTDPTQPQGLDAGAAITISGSNGAKQLTGKAGVYGAQLATSANGGKLYLDPGAYTVSGPGGADLGAIQCQLTAPPPIAWTNAASLTSVSRSQGVTVTWTGGDPNGFVYISGNSILAQGGGAMFTCTAPNSAGTFTVPPTVTMALPASSSGSLTVTGVSTPVSFTAPGVDIGLATASSAISQPESFQ
jgi:uncharacterized protein (TIGR03437 family)